jgi:hypothetical protein
MPRRPMCVPLARFADALPSRAVALEKTAEGARKQARNLALCAMLIKSA